MGIEPVMLALFTPYFNQMSWSQGHFDGFFTKSGTINPVSGGSSQVLISSSEFTTFTAVIKPSFLPWGHERGNISAPCQDPAMMINQGLWPGGTAGLSPECLAAASWLPSVETAPLTWNYHVCWHGKETTIKPGQHQGIVNSLWVILRLLKV